MFYLIVLIWFDFEFSVKSKGIFRMGLKTASISSYCSLLFLFFIYVFYLTVKKYL